MTKDQKQHIEPVLLNYYTVKSLVSEAENQVTLQSSFDCTIQIFILHC